MNRIWILPLMAAVCITAVFGIVVATDDAGLLIPAPEDVAEGFLGALETKRFSPARQYLSQKSKARI